MSGLDVYIFVERTAEEGSRALVAGPGSQLRGASRFSLYELTVCGWLTKARSNDCGLVEGLVIISE